MQNTRSRFSTFLILPPFGLGLGLELVLGFVFKAPSSDSSESSENTSICVPWIFTERKIWQFYQHIYQTINVSVRRMQPAILYYITLFVSGSSSNCIFDLYSYTVVQSIQLLTYFLQPVLKSGPLLFDWQLVTDAVDCSDRWCLVICHISCHMDFPISKWFWAQTV